MEMVLPNKELKKGDTSYQLRMEIDPKTPASNRKPALQEFVSPSSESVGNLHVEAGLQEGLLFDELSVEKKSSKCKNTTESAVLNEVPSNSAENLSNAQNVIHSFSIHEIGNSLLPTEKGNSKDVCGDRVIVMKRRKKLVFMEKRCQEVPDEIDVRRHPNAVYKRKRARSKKESTKNCIKMNITCAKLQPPNITSNQVAESNVSSAGVNLSNKDLLHDDASNTKGSKQVDILVDQNLTLQMTSFAKDGTSPSFLTDSLQEISNFGNGISDIVLEVENRNLPPTLKEDCALAEAPTHQVASFAQVDFDTSASFLRGNLQEISNFSDGLRCIANDVENRGLPPSLQQDCAVARSNSIDATVGGTSRCGIIHDIEGYEAEITLPFVKRSSLWESIDSMDVFRRMPQKPHFRALEQQYCKKFREGMAIGLMVTFANLVDDLRKLDIFDSEASFEEGLKNLKDLEENGFNVENLQSQIEKLLEIRNNLNEFQNKTTTVKKQMIEREFEKDKVDRSIKDVMKYIVGLNKQRDSLIIQQQNNKSEIA